MRRSRRSAPQVRVNSAQVRAATSPRRRTDWRSGLPPEQLSTFDQFYMSRQPSFRGRHASFEEIEELMFVQGMTPEIFHGSWRRTEQGQYLPIPGLKDVQRCMGEARSTISTLALQPF